MQVLGIIGAYFLRGLNLRFISLLLLLSSLVILLALGAFVGIDALEEFHPTFSFDLLNFEERTLILFGLWSGGMAGQLIGLLFLCLRFRKMAARMTELETFTGAPQNHTPRNESPRPY